MAGRGPAPKPAKERRNFTPPSRGDWVDLDPLKKPCLPPLPKRGKGRWSVRTKRAYEGWRKDPVTQTFGENEIAATIELAFLQEELSRGKLSLASEIRQRADGLGLTLKGKRDLRFRIKQDEQPEPQKPRASKASGRRAHLTAVK